MTSQNPLRIIFFGNEQIATGVTTSAPLLRALLANGHSVVAVVIAQKSTAQSRRRPELAVAAVAAEHNIPVYTPAKLADIKAELANFEATIGVLVAYGKLVPQSVIDIFPAGIVNIHPSLLPRHRGSIPIEAAILDGDCQTGVSLMHLVRAMDAGPVYAQATVALTGSETKQALADQLLELGKTMLLQNLAAIVDGSLQPTPQTEAGLSYDSRLEHGAGQLEPGDWNQPPDQLERKVRAYAGWPRFKTILAGKDIIITQAHASPDPSNGLPGTLWLGNKQLGLHTADGVLLIDRLIPAGKKEMSAEAFLAGYKITD